MKYIVTGVDGQLGGRVAENMLKEKSGEDLIFTCPFIERIPKDKLQAWKDAGVSVRIANYDNKEEMLEAFKGGERLYMVSSIINGPERIVQHKKVIDTAIEVGVKHITYTSFLGADRKGYNQYVLPDHTATEEYLAQSDIKYNIMRNNLYLENYLINSVILANLTEHKWLTTAGEGVATFIAKDDSGRVATALLLGKGEENKAYDITGPRISQREICQLIAKASNIDYVYTPVSNEEYFEYMETIHIPRETSGDYSKSPVPFCSNDIVTNEYGICEGLMDVETNNVELLTGQKPLGASELIEKYSFVWREQVKSYWDLIKYL